MKIARSVAATEAAISLVWLLPIAVLAFVSAAAALMMVTRLYMGCMDADDYGVPVIGRAM